MGSPTALPPSDEEMRKLLKPNPSEEQVLNALKESYDVPGVKILSKLDSYDDINYMCKVRSGVIFLVKVHNGVESKNYIEARKKGSGSQNQGSVIDLQNHLMTHLNKNGIPTSQPQRTYEKSIERVSSPEFASIHSLPVISHQHSPAMLVLRLLSWVPGRTMSSILALPIESMMNAGKFLGRMDRHLDEFKLDDNIIEAANRYHAWDGKRTNDLRNFVHHIKDDKRRKMIVSILDAFQKELVDSGIAEGFRKGMIQGDFNDANILVNENLLVSGVIDFGDSVYSWRVLDISVALMYAMLSPYGKRDRAISAAAAMLRGYHSRYPLTDLEREHLYLLIACRFACSTTLGAYSYSQNPGNEYLLLHAEPAWKALEMLWGYDSQHRLAMKNAINRIFNKACDEERQSPDDVGCSDLEIPDPSIVDLLSAVRETNNDANENDELLSRKRLKVVESKKVGEITFVTGNKKKLEEVRRILESDASEEPIPITNRKIDLPELQGGPLEIAKAKCSEAAKIVGGPVITEDTSLCFHALSNLPGPYIKWFLEKCGLGGLNDMIAFSQDKSAYAQTIVAFCIGPEEKVLVFDGRTEGQIVRPRGNNAFGWDPIFQPNEGKGKTYAEMSKQEKDAISHRSRAFAQLREYFRTERKTILSSMNK